MTRHEFIFSNKLKPRLARHLVFWITYCIYFYIQSIPPQTFTEFFIAKTYFIALINLCTFVPVFIITTYFLIYYLLPKTIMKRKYLLFITGFLLSYIAGTAINYFTTQWFLFITGYFPNTFQHRIEMSNYNTRWGMIIATIALGIKLTENWYLQQQQNFELIKRKAKAEMQSEKARIHPELLLRSLNTIHSNIQINTDKAPSLILNLSEILSYSLYENDNIMVLLKSELFQLQNLIALEQSKKESGISVQLQVKGDTNNYIVPMVFIKIVETIISRLYKENVNSCLLQIDLVVHNEMLLSTFTLYNDTENNLQNISWSFFITGIRNRLSNHYNSTDFKIKLDNDKKRIIINLQLKLLTQLQKMDLL